MRRIHSETVRTGRNSEHPSLDDAQYIKCWNCSFICHPQRDARALDGTRGGDGLSTVGTSEYTYDTLLIEYDDLETSYDGYNVNRTTVDDGCPMCGCLNWNKEIPNYG